jgi:hypothetical protein
MTQLPIWAERELVALPMRVFDLFSMSRPSAASRSSSRGSPPSRTRAGRDGRRCADGGRFESGSIGVVVGVDIHLILLCR